jgi:hypothetical protein
VVHDNAVSRRTFLSSAAAGVLASGILPAFGEEYKSAWTNGKQINPSIDNLRVVCCIDPAMIKGDPRSWDVASQNAPVVAEKVQADMDALACGLAQKSAPHEAWGSIFRKPSSKEWSDVKVAIKPNSFVQNNPRVAVVNAVCKALIGLGVQPSNIIIYDGGGDPKGKYGPYIGSGLPAGIIASKGNDAMGGSLAAPVPKPHKGMFKCSAALVNGTIDILVNIAVNKGSSFAGMTMTLKNHAGTFDPKPIHLGGGLDYILAFNKSEAILGGEPVRQQLCVIDSIWAMTKGPFGVPNKRPAALVMGTFSPAVDYVTARRIREQMMGCPHLDTLDRIMSEFGYANFENLDFVKVEPAAL